MKNIHVLPTEKPSILYAKDDNYKLANSTIAMDWYISSAGYKPCNIYITSDEGIKDGDWYFDENKLKVKRYFEKREAYPSLIHRFEIILTTDQDLIKDGVQAIDDEFLEWFVKNPSCEKVEVNNLSYGAFGGFADAGYKIIIPKEEPKQTDEKGNPLTYWGGLEEPKQHVEFINNNIDQLDKAIESFKQETLEEAAEKYTDDWEEITGLDYDQQIPGFVNKLDFINGAKWQQEQIGKSEFLQKLRATKSDAEARRLIFEQFKNK